MRAKRIVVVEDETIVAADLEARLRSRGYDVAGTTGSGKEASSLAERVRADLVLMDIQLGGNFDGIDAAEQITTNLDIPVVFLTAHADETTFERAKITSPFGYVLKPFGDRELHTAIEMGLYRHAAEGRIRKTQQWLEAVLENLGNALVVTDQWGLVEVMNSAASMLSGWTREEAHLKPFDEVFGIVDAVRQEPVRFPREGVTVPDVPRSLLLITRAGDKIPVDCSASPVRDRDGRMTGMVWLLANRSQRDFLEKQSGVA